MNLLLLLGLLAYTTLSHSQLQLPNPPYIPPNVSDGVEPSSTTTLPNPQWLTLLGNLLYFYDAQRSGKLPTANRVSWRNDSALQDGKDANIDLSGGYYDAGDYIKATYPLSFTLSSICWGALTFGNGFESTNQTAYLDGVLRWGLDWLIKAHPSSNVLYVLVSDPSTDGSYWGGDRNIPIPRHSFQINNTSPGTDAAAGASAAFSACSALYAGRTLNSTLPALSLKNETYANVLLNHSEQLFSFAVNATGGQILYQKSVPAVAQAYGSSTFEDELTYAAVLLSLASNSSSYFNLAEEYFDKYSLRWQNGIYNWDSKTPALAVLFTQIAKSQPTIGRNLSSWQSEAERYFDRIVNNQGPGYLTKGGLLVYDGVSDSASLNTALGVAMIMTVYAQYATTPGKTANYLKFANGQIDYTLGNNPMSCPYVVGSSPNSPKNPHSAMASGGTDIGAIDISPRHETYVLYGAVVGGPDRWDRFFDIRSDWPETEPALDINAPMVVLAAYKAMTDVQDPYFVKLKAGAFDDKRPSGLPCDSAYPCPLTHPLSRSGKLTMAIVLGVTGGAIFVLGSIWTYYAYTRAKY